MNEYKLLSLDTSTSSTGWAVYINGNLSEYGVLTNGKGDTQSRLHNMIKSIFDLISSYSPAAIVIETPVVVRNPKVQRLLTMIFGAVYGKCVVDHIEFNELRPTEWRKLIDSGKKPRKREELKEWSIKKVKDLFYIENINDDMSDAILIGQAYINSFK